MTTVAQSVTKIRRLIKDPNSNVITTDNPILKLIGRVQQDFARKTLCLAKVKEIEAPSNVEYAITYNWEEGYVDSAKVFTPFLRDGTYSSSQPFELAGSYDLDGGTYTITCGDDAISVDPQHELPVFPGIDYYQPVALFWNYDAVEQKSWGVVDKYYTDGWHFSGTEVDFFCHHQATRKKAIVTRGVPTTKPDDILTTRARSLLNAAMRASIFIIVYYAVPERPTATTDDMEVQEPFIKYIEFEVASRLLKSFNQLRNREKAAHLGFRYEVGVTFTRGVVSKKVMGKVTRLGSYTRGKGRKPFYPRLPQHYPALRTR